MDKIKRVKPRAENGDRVVNSTSLNSSFNGRQLNKTIRFGSLKPLQRFRQAVEKLKHQNKAK